MRTVPSKEYVEKQVEDRAISTWYWTGGYDRREVQGFEIPFFHDDVSKVFRAETKEQLVEKILDYFIDEAKSSELIQLALKYGKGKRGGFMGMLLPSKGLVKLVMENCPTWKAAYGDMDPRGAGFSIGRRVAKLRIPQEPKETTSQ